jgi:hypothetical protein
MTPRLRLRKRPILATSLGVLAALAVYFGTVVARSIELYGFVKGNSRGWNGNVYACDPVLGFAPVPGSRGEELLPIGPPIPVRYDADGFRVPAGAQPDGRSRPLLLALGCSYTYGAACNAEDTYPYRLGQALGGRTLNAAVSSYGLAQMLVLARRLIPDRKPDLVVLQYSPWLVDRAQSPFAPAYFGVVPVPYLSEARDGTVEIAPPVFVSAAFDVPVADYRGTPGGILDLVSFLGRVGLPLAIHDDVCLTAYWLRWAHGGVPRPVADRRKIIWSVYGEIGDLCRHENAQLVVVLLGQVDDADRAGLEEARSHAGFTIIDAWDALSRELPQGTPFERQYAHWRGDPPVCVDMHPNALAHSLIAEAIRKAVAIPP